MKTIKMKSGGHVLIFPSRAEFILNEICFTDSEWEHARKVIAGNRDPEEVTSFWATLIEKKRADPAYDFHQDFPKEAPREELKKAESSNARLARETLEKFKAHREGRKTS